MRYQVAPRMEMFSGLTYTKRKLPTRELSINASSGQYGLSVLPADNPYNPFGVDVGVDFTYEDTGVFVDFENTYLRSEEHTSELQSLMRISYAVFCLKKKKKNKTLNRTKFIIKKKL